MSCSGNCNQGRNCACLPVTMDEPEGPGMAVSRWVYALGIACGVLWTAAYVFLIS